MLLLTSGEILHKSITQVLVSFSQNYSQYWLEKPHANTLGLSNRDGPGYFVGLELQGMGHFKLGFKLHLIKLECKYDIPVQLTCRYELLHIKLSFV